jgi:hypothetical protein
MSCLRRGKLRKNAGASEIGTGHFSTMALQPRWFGGSQPRLVHSTTRAPLHNGLKRVDLSLSDTFLPRKFPRGSMRLTKRRGQS